MMVFLAVLGLTAWAFCNMLDVRLISDQRWLGGVAGIGAFWLLCRIWERGRGPPRRDTLRCGESLARPPRMGYALGRPITG